MTTGENHNELGFFKRDNNTGGTRSNNKKCGYGLIVKVLNGLVVPFNGSNRRTSAEPKEITCIHSIRKGIDEHFLHGSFSLLWKFLI